MAFSNIIRGKVWKFGENVSTTDITPGEMFRGTDATPVDMVFAGLRPDWKHQVRPGDCIVAGKNFGFGSHRTEANDVMKMLGLGCIVADSVARIYYRNAIATGFPAVACPGISEMFEEGDEIELNVETGEVKNLTTGAVGQAKPYPPVLLDILRNGGMVPAIVAMFAEEEA